MYWLLQRNMLSLLPAKPATDAARVVAAHGGWFRRLPRAAALQQPAAAAPHAARVRAGGVPPPDAAGAILSRELTLEVPRDLMAAPQHFPGCHLALAVEGSRNVASSIHSIILCQTLSGPSLWADTSVRVAIQQRAGGRYRGRRATRRLTHNRRGRGGGQLVDKLKLAGVRRRGGTRESTASSSTSRLHQGAGARRGLGRGVGRGGAAAYREVVW